jgi:transcriptional regulator of arginine metabolism
MLNDDIIRLIDRGVNDQSELLAELKLLGHELTQSSISRKLKTLGINKIHGKYQRMLKTQQTEIKISFVAPNMIVVHTLPGRANFIAAIIDEQLIDKDPEFIGSIAGDDTIFIAIDLKGKDSDLAIKKLKEII